MGATKGVPVKCPSCGRKVDASRAQERLYKHKSELGGDWCAGSGAKVELYG